MNIAILKAWVLSVLLAMEPNTSWKDTYESTAEAFATQAFATPLFKGDEDGRRTASIFISVAWFEGHFKQDAAGDCDKTNDKGMCVKGSTPHSFCTFQINESNFKGLGVTREQVQNDIKVCTRAAATLMRKSFDICKGRPMEDRLNQYATGGGECLPDVPKGRHRMLKGKWIFDRYPLSVKPVAKADTMGVLPTFN